MTTQTIAFLSFSRFLFNLLVFCLLAALMLPVRQVRAQTEQPTRDVIDAIEARLVLPYGIRFITRLTIPKEEVKEIMLSVNQENGVEREWTLNLEETLFIDYGDRADFEYVWAIEDEPIILFFAPLTYRFAITTTAGELSEEEAEIRLAHQGFGDWQSDEAALLSLHWYDGLITNSFSIVKEVQTAFALLQQHTALQQPVGLVLYKTSDLEKFCTQVDIPATEEEEAINSLFVIDLDDRYPCTLTAMQDLYRRNGIEIVTLESLASNAVEATIIARLVEFAYQFRWQDADIPAWFRIGLERFYYRFGVPNGLAAAVRASQQDQLLPLAQLETLPAAPLGTSETFLWESQSYLLTLFLADSYGAETPFTLAQTINDETSFSAALAEITAESMAQIYRRWRAWLTTSVAEQAVAWNPYQPTTPTPTPTPTIIPTRLPSATPTATPSVTPTTFGADRARATIQFEPTRPQRIPSPATITPLPAGSLNNPTPVAGDSSEQNDDNGGLCGSGIGAVVMPLVALLWSKRKRKKDPVL